MKNSEIDAESSIQERIDSKIVEFNISSDLEIKLTIPKTVYPPREDTALLAEALTALPGNPGKAVEIGSGSGALSITLANRGWQVEAYDVNPFAVIATQQNAGEAGFTSAITANEGGIGEPGFCVESADLIFWNLPYLAPPSELEPRLEWIEEASMSDIPGEGWGALLESHLRENPSSLKLDGIVILLQRSDPSSPSSSAPWRRNGWACRTLAERRLGEEKLEVVAYWKPGGRVFPKFIETCNSTMEEAVKLPPNGWQRVCSQNQTGGRGRRKSTWVSKKGDLSATWNLNSKLISELGPGLIQSIIGNIIAEEFAMYAKWPNDIVTSDWRKYGGILIETDSTSKTLRVGVGINRENGVVDGIETAGWEEIDSTLKLRLVFDRIDARLSSLFEQHYRLPNHVEKTVFQVRAWRGYSRLISRGTECIVNGENVRVVGVDKNASLIIEKDALVTFCDDIGATTWNH